MNPKNFKNFKHDQCNYIYNHQYKLNDFENDSLNFYTYSKIPNCPFCNKKKNVKYVVKFNKSRTYKNVANILDNYYNKKKINNINDEEIIKLKED